LSSQQSAVSDQPIPPFRGYLTRGTIVVARNRAEMVNEQQISGGFLLTWHEERCNDGTIGD
jgi:hypothetical protein